ncbi:MAG: Stp1/IreP family PP2C-type Ser/Thr phosphatase [Myxococcales bacterium]|nr:Stp1/IreP family PP2C-type Ser/Thr phosphatase [Myxococcales bacterium]USN50118.1 MAG: Stp1/IreP family PP2C-type Ser/Thr phosphatase [Myxococcales bacterium]
MASLISWAKSDIGRKRSSNEDCYFASDEIGLYVVADGMGGHRAGDHASKLAIESATREFIREYDKGCEISEALSRAVANAALRVFNASQDNLDLRGMGTTLSMLAVKNGRAHIAHVGDSRIYCIRNNQIHQLTSDHSLVNEQVQAGIMSPDEARTSALRNIITRAIGHNKTVSADHFSLSVKKGDFFLLCTDGLNNMLIDSEIVGLINSLRPDFAINKMIENSNKNGGDDNITAILVQVSL